MDSFDGGTPCHKMQPPSWVALKEEEVRPWKVSLDTEQGFGGEALPFPCPSSDPLFRNKKSGHECLLSASFNPWNKTRGPRNISSLPCSSRTPFLPPQ